ncbi:MAG: solute carrier family 23 protein, partial [Spirochaetaceae bacterium]|nr:solute carrier family 23 protein [Spirochaetaceae bacterium]
MAEKDLSGKNVVLGIQHTFVMFGATVLVPIITGLDVGVTLFAAGIGTLLFHLVTGWKVPVFLGSSFAFIPGIIAVGASEGLPYALGGIAVAGLLYVVVSIIFRFISYDNLHKILPPHVTGPMIILIGLILAPVAIQNARGDFSAPIVEAIGVNGAWGIALFTFAVGIFVKIALPKFGLKFMSNLPVLIALIAGYILAIIIGIVDFSSVGEASWVGIPKFTAPK